MKDKEKNLSLTGKIASILSGPFTGMLPPRWQVGLARGNEEAASYMSTTSRVVNSLWTLLTVASLGAKAFGADIDPTPGDIATWSGIAVAINTLIREAWYAGTYYMAGGLPNMTYHEPWGEPIISYIDSKIKPEWYGK